MQLSQIIRKRQILSESYVEDLQYLKSYLSMTDEQKAEDIAYKMSYLLDDWIDSPPAQSWAVNVEIDKEGKEHFEVVEEMDAKTRQRFGKWIMQYRGHDQDELPDMPSWMFFSRPKLLLNTWLVHQSDYAHKIADEGFKKLMWDMQSLGLTNLWTDTASNRDPGGKGYGFAYTLDDFERYGHERKYGNEAVIFQASGIRVYHNGDEEYQTIFWGPSAKNINYINADGEVVNKKTRRVIYNGGTIEKAIDWFARNYEQYRKVLY